MALTLGDLENLVWSSLDDYGPPAGQYFTEPQVKAWLNNAQREVQKQIIQAGENWYVTRSTTSTVADESTYGLPQDFLKVNKLEVVLSGTGVEENRATLSPTTLVQLDRIYANSGKPQAYAIRKNALVFAPVPDAAYTLYMDYTYLVADMDLGEDVPDVPLQYQEYIAVLATLEGFYKDGRDPGPFLEKKRYYEALMKQDAEDRKVDAPRSVICTEDGDVGFVW